MPNLYEICPKRNVFNSDQPTSPGEYEKGVAVTGWNDFEPLLIEEIERCQSDNFFIKIMSDNRSVVLPANNFLQVIQPLAPVDIDVFASHLFKKD